MKTVNALKVRTKFGRVIEDLRKSGKPVLLSRGKEIEAALVPIELFKARFVDLLAEDEIETIQKGFSNLQTAPLGSEPTLATLRKLRGPLA